MRFLRAATIGLRAFKHALDLDQVAAPPAANDDSSVEQLQARFLALQAKAASGTRGAVQARRELSKVRHALLRREAAGRVVRGG